MSGSSVLRTGIPEGTSEKLVLLPWSSWPVSYGASLFPEGGAWLKCCWGGAGLGPSDFGVLEASSKGLGGRKGSVSPVHILRLKVPQRVCVVDMVEKIWV